MGLIFFLPIYLICLVLSGARSSKIRSTFKEGIQAYRNKGFSFGSKRKTRLKTSNDWWLLFFPGKFFTRSCLFSLLWMLTNFLYIRGLVNLGCTEMISIFATHVSFVYLLSWVVLHEQFVGIRVSVAGDKRTNTNTKAVRELYSLGKSTWHNNSSTFF